MSKNITTITNGAERITIISNGGDPIKDCPKDWESANAWEREANKNNECPVAPKWKWDCGFKLDYDGALIRIDSRFYPPKTHSSPKWDGSVSVILLNRCIMEQKFSCETLEELRSDVEGFKNKLLDSIREVFGPIKTTVRTTERNIDNA